MEDLVNWLSGNVVEIVSVIIAGCAFGYSKKSYINTLKQTAISERALAVSKEAKEASNRSAIAAEKSANASEISVKATEISANASVKSAELAERAIIENIKPVINLVIRKNSDETIYKDEEHFYFFDIFLQNIGNRGCKNVVVKITPSIYVERYFGETKNGDLGILEFEDRTTKSVGYRKFPLLNPKSQISFTGYGEMTCVSILGPSKHTITIDYEDLDGNQQKTIKITSNILELQQETLLR